jgi:hypothetical protein
VTAPTGLDRLKVRIVEAIRVGPASGRSLARRLARRRDDVSAACEALAATGRIVRDGSRWTLAPAGRCAGLNAEGERCGRVAAPGEVFCLHHAPTVDCGNEIDPANPGFSTHTPATDAFTFDWSIPAARMYASASPAKTGTRWIEEARRWLSVHGVPVTAPMTLRQAQAVLNLIAVDRGLPPGDCGLQIPSNPEAEEAAFFAAFDHEDEAVEIVARLAPEWYAKHVAWTLTPAERANGFVEGQQRPARRTPKKVEPGTAEPAPSAEDDDMFIEEIES